MNLIGEFDEFLLEFGRYPLGGGLCIEFSDLGFSPATFHFDNEFCDARLHREREYGTERLHCRHRLHPLGICVNVCSGGFEMSDVCRQGFIGDCRCGFGEIACPTAGVTEPFIKSIRERNFAHIARIFGKRGEHPLAGILHACSSALRSSGLYRKTPL